MYLRFTVFYSMHYSMHLLVYEMDVAAVFQNRIPDCKIVLGPSSPVLQQREILAIIVYLCMRSVQSSH